MLLVNLVLFCASESADNRECLSKLNLVNIDSFYGITKFDVVYNCIFYYHILSFEVKKLLKML